MSQQKSYAYKKGKLLEFEVGNEVLLEISQVKDVMGYATEES